MLQTSEELDGRITDAEAQLTNMKKLRSHSLLLWPIEQKGVVLQPGLEANRLGHAEQCIKSLWLASDRACGAVRVHRQTAQQQIREQQQSIESARTSILGFRRDFEREAQAMQVCLKHVCGMPLWWAIPELSFIEPYHH